MATGDDSDTSRPIELDWDPAGWLAARLRSSRPTAVQFGSDPMQRRDFLAYLAALTGGAALPEGFHATLQGLGTQLGRLQLVTDFLRDHMDLAPAAAVQRLLERHADQIDDLAHQASRETGRRPLLALLAETRGHAGFNAFYSLGDHGRGARQLSHALIAARHTDLGGIDQGLDQWVMTLQAEQMAFSEEHEAALDLLDAASYLADDPASRASLATHFAGAHAFIGGPDHEQASLSALDGAADALEQLGREGGDAAASRWLAGRSTAGLHAVRGLCLLEVGRPAAAVRVLNQVGRDLPFGSSSGRHGTVLCDLGCAYADLDEPKLAALHGLDAVRVIGPLGSLQRRRRLGRLDQRLARPRFAGVPEVADFRRRVARLVA